MSSGDSSLLAPFDRASVADGSETVGSTATLRTVGVPKRVELPDWLGPALFVSAIREGRASTLAEVMPSARARRAAWVLGRHEEQDGSIVHALFVLDREEVWLIETATTRARFVATDLARFLRCMAAFVRTWPEPSPQELWEIDARAMDAEGFWPALIELVMTE